MPELPEVETVRRVLLPYLKERKIIAVQIYNSQVIAAPSAEEIVGCVQGQAITGLARRGKFLQLQFASGDRLAIHLRMTGSLTVESQDSPLEKYTHAVFTLDNGNQLRYADVRRFGRIWYIPKAAPDMSGAEKLGPEPSDKSLTAAYLKDKLRSSKKSVKTMLLDQSVVAGIGNIYSDEILFAAGIYPGKPCRSLTDDDLERLAEMIPKQLSYFTEKNAISFEDYTASKGTDYRNTPFLQVYGKAGKPCPVCGGTLQRLVLGGRSSVFCPHCQK